MNPGKGKLQGQRSVSSADTITGNRLRALRLDHRMSQQDVADHLGISFQQVQKYEKGINRVSITRASQLAALFKTSLQELTGTSGNLDMETRFDNESYKLAQEFRLLPGPVKIRLRQLIKSIVEIR
jgi:transcriptional regulator with XRE-family HTH domain